MPKVVVFMLDNISALCTTYAKLHRILCRSHDGQLAPVLRLDQHAHRNSDAAGGSYQAEPAVYIRQCTHAHSLSVLKVRCERFCARASKGPPCCQLSIMHAYACPYGSDELRPRALVVPLRSIVSYMPLTVAFMVFIRAAKVIALTGVDNVDLR